MTWEWWAKVMGAPWKPIHFPGIHQETQKEAFGNLT